MKGRIGGTENWKQFALASTTHSITAVGPILGTGQLADTWEGATMAGESRRARDATIRDQDNVDMLQKELEKRGLS